MAKRTKIEKTLRVAHSPEDASGSRSPIGAAPKLPPAAATAGSRKPAKNGSVEARARIIDARKLRNLYQIKRLTLAEIAEDFRVSLGVIDYALQLNEIPKRNPVRRGMKYLDLLGNLSIGETIEIECRVKNARIVLRSSARRLGIKVSVLRSDRHFHRVTRLDPDSSRRDFNCARMDADLLKELYCDSNLNLEKIASQMNCTVEILNFALDYHQIPKRSRDRGYGKYTSVLKKMKIGEIREIESLSKYPQGNLHTIATRIGIKISVRTLTNGKFRVTKLA